MLPSSFTFLLCVSHCNSKMTRESPRTSCLFMTQAPHFTACTVLALCFPAGRGQGKAQHWFSNEANGKLLGGLLYWSFTAGLFFIDGQDIRGKSISLPILLASEVGAATSQMLKPEQSGPHCWLFLHLDARSSTPHIKIIVIMYWYFLWIRCSFNCFMCLISSNAQYSLMRWAPCFSPFHRWDS